MEIHVLKGNECLYTYVQSKAISVQTGLIGHLRADMDTDGEGFFSSWFNFRTDLNTDKFKAEFDQVINRLRFGPTDENGIQKEDDDCFLKNRSALARYCWSQPSAKMPGDNDNFGFCVKTDDYAYMMRLNPNKGSYNLYCYCYRRDWLEQHLEQAEAGIRFIDSNYNTLFTIPENGKIVITDPDGAKRYTNCRYIDRYRFEDGEDKLYHIREFAELMEKTRCKCEPNL